MKLNSIIGSLAASSLACFVLCTPVQAQTAPKFGTVDLKKLFEGYYKTKQADGQIREHATDSEKVLKGMIDDYQKANEDYKKAIEGANDQAVSSEERDKRKKAAETKVTEIQDLEKSIQTFRRTTQTNLDDQKRRMRDRIVAEIREVVNAKAKIGTYNLILDTSADSMNQTPFILFNSGMKDLTEEILADLNKSAPAPSLTNEKDKDKDKDKLKVADPAPEKAPTTVPDATKKKK